MKIQRQVTPFKASEKLLFTAKSYLVDRFTPAVEKILLPSFSFPEGELEISYSGKETTKSSREISKKAKIKAAIQHGFGTTLIDGVAVDYRYESPSNWAHALNFHIPFAFFIIDNLKQHGVDILPVFILDENTPSYIRNVFALFGLKTAYHSNDVKARFVEFRIAPFDCLRSFAREWIENYIFPLAQFQHLLSTPYNLGSRVLLLRKQSRAILNEHALRKYCEQRGFFCTYPEDHSVEEQLQIFLRAELIMAIHGAAMGPMLYRGQSEPQLKVLEILTPGHMTNYYRGMADQVGVEWVGVRGCLEKKHVIDAYNFSERFVKYSLDKFEVCLDSVSAGLSELKIVNV